VKFLQENKISLIDVANNTSHEFFNDFLNSSDFKDAHIRTKKSIVIIGKTGFGKSKMNGTIRVLITYFTNQPASFLI
jgi:energy-coupling factor transporter ATP-binding protein EcfA2